MSPNPQPFPWTKRSNKVAQLVAEDKLSDEQIASSSDITRRTLARWKLHPDFAARVQSIVEESAAALKAKGILDRANRLEYLRDRHERMNQVITERAAAEEFADVPGGKTGLMAHNIKVVGGGPNAERVDVFEVDTGLLREMRATEQQAAQEQGQWAEKRELTGKDGGPIKGDFTWSDLVKLAAEEEA